MIACSPAKEQTFQGYVEGEYLYLAAPQAGYLSSLDAPRGSRISLGQTVFVVDQDLDHQVVIEAQSRAESARQKLQNLKQPRRVAEIATLEANLQAAQAGLELARIELQQQQQLFRKHYVAQIKVDEARSSYDQASAQVNAIKKQIANYQNTVGRQAEIKSAESDLAAAQAQIEQKRWVVDRKTVKAPDQGEITETYYQPGEWVPAGAAVASLLPDNKRKIRFFVPESELATIQPGARIEAHCDGCKAPIQAKINFIAAQAEYTPPVIYSRDTRQKLVFRVEALPDPEQAVLVRPGLPVDVKLAK